MARGNRELAALCSGGVADRIDRARVSVRACVSDEGEQHELSVERRGGSQVFAASLEPLGFDAVTLTKFGELGVAGLGQIEGLEILRWWRTICV